jgi:muconate cycloisomerase
MSDRVEIVGLETCIVDVPTIRPHILSVATIQSQSMVLIRLICSDGVEGIGEGTTIGGLSYGGESPERIKLTVDTYITPLIQGQDATRPAVIMALFNKPIVDNHFAKSSRRSRLSACDVACITFDSALIKGNYRSAVQIWAARIRG